MFIEFTCICFCLFNNYNMHTDSVGLRYDTVPISIVDSNQMHYNGSLVTTLVKQMQRLLPETFNIP